MRVTLAAVTLATAATAMLVLSGCSGQPNTSAPPAPGSTTTAPDSGGGTAAAAPGPGPGPGPASGPDRPAPPAAPGPQPPERCAGETGTWNTAAESAGEYSSSALYNSRIGRHDCYDRVVFDVNGPGPVGYDVRYVPVVSEDGSGKPIPVASEAALQVVVRAPAQGSQGDASGHQPGVVFAPSGARLHGPGGLENWGCLREVRSAGSFEGQTTLAIGVRDKLPFRVDTWTDSNQTTHVSVDLACQ